MRILITGSQGFIGSRLVERLWDAGHDVVGYTRADGILSLGALVAKMAGADVVIHAAACLQDDLLECVRVNVLGTANVVEAATQCGCHSLIYLSTLRGLYLESGRPIGESSPEADPHGMGSYLLSKWMGELAVQRFPRQWLILRLSGVYGLGRKYRTLVERMLTDEIVSVRSGRELCDMVPVGDVVQAMEKAIQRLESLESGTFIIASGTRQTVGEVASMAQKLHPFVLEDRDEPAMGWRYDVGKARRLLDYAPTPLLEGLSEYQKEIGDAVHTK
jgi:nucleoside-diphosphate-sugar epimerase